MQVQITNSMASSSSSKSPQLKIGDTFNVTIKEKLNKTEAVVSFKGTIATVKFEGGMPQGSQVAIEVTGLTEEGDFIVKVSESNASSSGTQKTQGTGTDTQLNEVVKSFTSNGVMLSKESVAAIKSYLKNDSYPMEQKLETLRMMAQKQIPVSNSTLISITEALNSQTLSQSLNQIVSGHKLETIPDFSQLLKHLKNETNNMKVLETVTDFIRSLEPSNKSIAEKLLLELKNTNTKEEMIQKLTSLVYDTDSLPLNQAFGKEEENSTVVNTPPTQTNGATGQYVMNEAMQATGIQSQNMIVTQVTEKMSQITIDFSTLKRDITRNLDTIAKTLDKQSVTQQVNVKQILESTIRKLDNAILKGDYLLYTDMATEKKLLSASSTLADAKRLLLKGEIAEANQKILEVKGLMEKINFNPSDVKVRHFVTEKLGIEGHPVRQLGQLMEQVVKPFSNGESSSRQMYEMFRRLGLTHENEIGKSLLSRNGHAANQPQENVKIMLLRLLANEDFKHQHRQQIEQIVSNLTGQQLLGKQDSTGQQNLFFQLPYMMDKQVENIKVYVNSRKDGNKIDWENCSIYFVLETKKLGETGVLLSSSERNVNLTFKNNKQHLQEKVDSLEEVVKERLKQIGYNLNSMNVKPLGEKKMAPQEVKSENINEKSPSENHEKRYDITI